MGVKDIEQKQLEDYNDVFADIVNVNIFGGKQVIKESELENTKDKTRFKSTDGVITEQERDVAKWWRHYGIRLVLIGLENQTKIDPHICFRLYGYDGAAYKSQYKAKKKYPVITLVLYFGNKRWNKAKSLTECLNVPDELKPFFNDYKMNLIEVAWQTDEQIAMYKSDFKIIADYFVQKRKNCGRYSPSKEKFCHVDAILKTMSALTGDDRFEQIINDRQKGERQVDNMCKVLDKVENRGIRKGMKEGRQEGRNELNDLYSYLYDQGRDADVKKACKDVEYQNELLEKYRSIKKHPTLGAI
ncbi:MAG: Rpn family recombination-promoting nuclease/putative transposase [Lachnospiraceae bacterium]|nr:Rpn family recombination-promoting nuclease/putative transposase [Lachnospiraceae bacterium]